VKRNLPPDDKPLTICEEALESFSHSDDSLAKLVERNNIEVRDFIILSFVCDQDELAVEQLSHVLGLNRDGVLKCLERLQTAGFVHYHQVAETAEASDLVTPTEPGREIASRMLAED
jgi:DNA-binding MarR family transcriptional regulator